MTQAKAMPINVAMVKIAHAIRIKGLIGSPCKYCIKSSMTNMK